MSGTSSVPDILFTATGLVLPTESAILAGVQADINASMGGGVNSDLRTPQGQLAQSTTAIIGDKNDALLALANNFDPAYASGRFQDALGRIYFIERNPAQATILPGCICTGAAGTVLSIGSASAQDDAGNIYNPTTTGTISSTGTVILDYVCASTGPIICPINTLSVYQFVPGWENISNPNACVPGNVVESRADFEFRREQSVALNGKGFTSAITGAVLNVPGVLDAFVTDNTTAGTLTVGGVALNPKSVYVCVVGGDPLAVATAIWTKKQPGCGYTGNTTQSVLDTNSGYAPPYPSYAVTFQTAIPTPVYFTVTILASAAVPSDALLQVQTAIEMAFAGADGGARARIGAEIFASRYYTPVALLGTWAQIISIQIGQSASPTGSTTTLSINEVPTIDPSNITLVLQ